MTCIIWILSIIFHRFTSFCSDCVVKLSQTFLPCRLTRTLGLFSPLCCLEPLLSWLLPKAAASWRALSLRWPWVPPGRRTSVSSAAGRGQGLKTHSVWSVSDGFVGLKPLFILYFQVTGSLVSHLGHATVQTCSHLHPWRGGRCPWSVPHAEHRTDAAHTFSTLSGTAKTRTHVDGKTPEWRRLHFFPCSSWSCPWRTACSRMPTSSTRPSLWTACPQSRGLPSARAMPTSHRKLQKRPAKKTREANSSSANYLHFIIQNDALF